MEKPAQNIQDSFLNTARREKIAVTIYLLSGVKLTGRIRSFDKYCLILESGSLEQMVFKHAISTLVLPRASHRDFPREAGERRPAAAPATHPLAAENAAAAIAVVPEPASSGNS